MFRLSLHRGNLDAISSSQLLSRSLHLRSWVPNNHPRQVLLLRLQNCTFQQPHESLLLDANTRRGHDDPLYGEVLLPEVVKPIEPNSFIVTLLILWSRHMWRSLSR